MKLLYKILVPVLLTVFIGLFVSTHFTYEMSIDALKDSNTSLQKMATSNALVELKAGLDFNILNAISLAQTGILQPYLSGEYELRRAYASDANDRIVNMTNTYHYVMIGIASTGGLILDHTEKELRNTSVINEPFFREAMQGKVSISSPYRYKNMVVYNVASPVYSVHTNAIIGVVYNVSKLTDTMSERMSLGEKGYIFVADKEGTVFIHQNEALVLRKNLKDFAWGQEILATGKGKISFEENSEGKIAQFDVLPEAGWIAVAVRDFDELSAPGELIRRNATFVAIGLLLLLTLIIYLHVSYIVAALLKAVQYAEQVAKGVLDEDLNLGSTGPTFFQKIWYNFSQKLPFKKKQKKAEKQTIHRLSEFDRHDEVGVLYRALQDMVQSMRAMVQKADDASRMKSEFLANMSHEIRTPLNAVIGLAHLCLESEESEHKKRTYVEKIEVAGKSLLGIINNVLDTSKIEAGMFELENVQFNLRGLGEQVLTIYQDGAASKKLSLIFDISPKLGGFYMGDPTRLGQVLNNLVGNAIKFTETGSVSVLCTPYDHLLQEKSIPEGTVPVCIKVVDTGIGISKQQEEMLFKPFSQADASITRRFGGTGLGLAISKQLVELMGGHIQVESTIGKGTTFTMIFFFPPVLGGDLKIRKEIEEGELHVNLSNKRILVVEDNMINQLIMEELLQKTEANITMADNGKIAVEMVQKSNYDLILMDMQMPVMDGIQATKIIRQSYSIEQLPIIAVTANAMKEDKDKGIAVGLNDYLTKPIDPKNLMVVLQQWLCE